MVLGFISLLLTFGQNYIAKIFISEKKTANIMLPCKLRIEEIEKDNGKSEKRLLIWNEDAYSTSGTRRILAVVVANTCAKGKVPLVSINGLHQLHIFIFF